MLSSLLAVDGTGALGVLGIGAVVAFVVYYLASQAQEKSVVRASLRQLEGYEVENLRDQELLNPLKERALVPVLNGLTGLGRRFTPIGYVDSIRKKFVYAGEVGPDAVDRFLAIRVITVVLIPVVIVASYVWLPLEGNSRLGVMLLLVMLLALGPDASLNRRVEARQLEIRRRLPDILDLLTISV